MQESQATRHAAREINGLVDALTKPIVVFHVGWAETLPDWLKGQIEVERLAQLLKREQGKATTAEAVAYLYTASLAQPLNADWTDIYCSLGTQYASQRGHAVPEGLAPKELTPDQRGQLDHFLSWLWRAATGARCSRQRKPHPTFTPSYHEQLRLF